MPSTSRKDPPQGVVRATLGPLCKSVDDVESFFRSMFQKSLFDLDYSVSPVPFNESALQKYKENKHILTIGVMRDSNGNIGLPNLPVSVAQKRAVEIVIDQLKQQGHKIVDFVITPEEHDEMSIIYMRHANLSLTHNLNSVNEGYEYCDSYYMAFLRLISIPDFIKKFISFVLGLVG
mmetsp:Transcript_51634/g.70922  ORF Transcript_51634/g.70922 Transcript_51634/m.70922 type:complete len:177 (+) Transcript_51634:851-1381(+)|eukprot:CAMPEP_0176385638 /NCGR_PEP_ID=MMETSP0126-20121128/35308_1 /TAXON_ID=141414 ORGANISM="Strombidinopsis acuminatum, Strain SPMC142" /NCGR_SAMPLE_ID=MMETSP0126 /ASSEMBLY_ACC=CAM_ASM_000229 /LENGTH=176 /DNA_ID=CAMNT_0017752115 /DNA_START=851 /DNA_END=1381 /DNA_ORIENTATION=-